jgi:ribonuclease VapC
LIVDTSAIMALAQNESHAAEITAALVGDPSPVIIAPVATECVIVLTSRLGATGRTVYERLRVEFAITVVSYTEEHALTAWLAFTRFGKGRHPAALNFGDCMSYAAARVPGQPLLAVGDDFAQTDLEFDGGPIGYWPGTRPGISSTASGTS